MLEGSRCPFDVHVMPVGYPWATTNMLWATHPLPMAHRLWGADGLTATVGPHGLPMVTHVVPL